MKVFVVVVAILVINFLGFYKTVRFSGSLWVMQLVKWVCFIFVQKKEKKVGLFYLF